MQIPYFRPNSSEPTPSTNRSSNLRALRFDMRYKKVAEPKEYLLLKENATNIVNQTETESLAFARANALYYICENSPIELNEHSVFVGGENPFLYNTMFDALKKDRFGSKYYDLFTDRENKQNKAYLYSYPCFDGHITPGINFIFEHGTIGYKKIIIDKIEEYKNDNLKVEWLNACLKSIDALELMSNRLSETCYKKYRQTSIEDYKIRAEVLENVPFNKPRSLREALQAYWLVHMLITIEIGGCLPGGGIGLGRPDQYFYPYYKNDIDNGIITKSQALEYIELFLLNFTHNDYYTHHAIFTPGTHGSLGGILPDGSDAFNNLSFLFMEASIRLRMPAPYLSLRLHKNMSALAMQACVNFITSGLGFPIVNDEVNIKGFIKQGRDIEDAKNYICSCCYENTIPGKEFFNPNGFYFNLAMVLELFLNNGHSLLKNEDLGFPANKAYKYKDFESLLNNLLIYIEKFLNQNIETCNRVDRYLQENRNYPFMSVFIDDCIETATDVCQGGAKYNLTGIIVSGLTNMVNSLAAIKRVVFDKQLYTMSQLLEALKFDFQGYKKLQMQLKSGEKWGNGDQTTGNIAKKVTNKLYSVIKNKTNARNGRYQLALYSFDANIPMGKNLGASPDGRNARQIITRNLNPEWGTDKNSPTKVLKSLSYIDMTNFISGTSLDLRFDPTPYQTEEGRASFADFLKGFIDMGVMQMQLTFADTETLLDARKNPQKYPHLMVKVAGYSARFIDLSEQEKDEIIGRYQK